MGVSQSFMFNTPVLPYAKHHLTVVYQGNNTLRPLTLQSLVVQRSTQQEDSAPSSTLNILPSPTMSKLPTSLPPNKHAHLAGNIAGGIVGGVALLLLITSGLHILTRWNRSRKQEQQSGTLDSTVVPEPFPVTEEAVHYIGPRKARLSQQNIGNPFMDVQRQPPLTKWSRCHTVPASLEQICSPSSAISEEDSRPPGPTVNPPVIQGGRPVPPMNTNTLNRQSLARIAETMHPAALGPLTPTSLSGLEAEREEDSGLRMAHVPALPPLYTTH